MQENGYKEEIISKKKKEKDNFYLS